MVSIETHLLRRERVEVIAMDLGTRQSIRFKEDGEMGALAIPKQNPVPGPNLGT